MSAQLMPITKRLTLIVTILTVFLFTIYFLPLSILAGSGLLTQVGGVTFVQGANHFWVTSPTPAFSGVTTANEQVTGTVGSQAVSATADASGNWLWTPETDLSGDNTVSITSGSQSVSFTLTIGNLPANIASASGSTLAPAGSISPTIILLAGGFTLVLFGSWGLRKSFKSDQ